MTQVTTRRRDASMERVTPKQLVEQRMGMLISALPGSETAKTRFKQAAIGCASQPGMSQCEPNSVLRAIFQCARLNLIPDPVLHHVAIVPFKNKGVKEATMIVEYRGLIELMKRANPSLTIKAGTVYENDEYELIEGTTETLRITKRAFEKKLKKGAPLFHYAVVNEPGATPIMVILGADEAVAIGKGSKAGSRPGTPWHDHPERMAEKTCVKRMERFVRMDPDKEETKQFREAIEWDERSDEAPSIGDDTEIMAAMAGEQEADVDDLSEGATRIGSAGKKYESPREKRSAPGAAPAADTMPATASQARDSSPAPDATSSEPPMDGPPNDVDMKKLATMVDIALDEGGIGLTDANRFLILKYAAGANADMTPPQWIDYKKTATRSLVESWRKTLSNMSSFDVEGLFAFKEKSDEPGEPDLEGAFNRVVHAWMNKSGVTDQEAESAAARLLSFKYELEPEQLEDQGTLADDIISGIENGTINLGRYEKG